MMIQSSGGLREPPAELGPCPAPGPTTTTTAPNDISTTTTSGRLLLLPPTISYAFYYQWSPNAPLWLYCPLKYNFSNIPVPSLGPLLLLPVVAFFEWWSATTAPNNIMCAFIHITTAPQNIIFQAFMFLLPNRMERQLKSNDVRCFRRKGSKRRPNKNGANSLTDLIITDYRSQKSQKEPYHHVLDKSVFQFVINLL